MANIRLAQRYANSIHGLVIEMNKEEKVREDMHTLHSAISLNSELSVLLKSPVIIGDQKLKIFRSIFEGKIETLTMQFIELLIKKGREEFLQDIAEAYFLIDFAHRGVTPITITTAQKVTDDALANIVSKLKELEIVKDVELTTKENPSLIGGFVLQFHDKLLDASVSRKLEIFGKEFEDNVYVKKI